MNFATQCSGIEAASVAWNPLGWKAQFFSEIDKFPCAVLAHHYPTVPNHGDMTKFKDWPDADLDVLAGGTPCQSFSNAGLRAGLDDPRGQLMLTFGATAARYRPRWLVWENVPGVLSSNGGRDFGAFLGLLGFLGYGFAYRVLDAQYVCVDGYPHAVPQRRQRVFVVGCLGDWRRAAAVLFERESLRGDPAPRRKAGTRVAGTASPGAHPGGFNGQDAYNDRLIAGTISAGMGRRSAEDPERDLLVVFGGNNTAGSIDVATACRAKGGSGHGDFESETFVAHTLRGDGFDASEDGTGRGTPLIPVPFDTTQITSAENRSNPQPGDPCHPLAAGGHAPAIAFPAAMSGTQHASTEELSPSLGAKNQTAIAFQERGRADGRSLEIGGDVAYAMTAPAGGGRAQERNVLTASSVRRLTPRECERLMGFPDDYTLIPWRTWQEAARKGASYEGLLQQRGMTLRGQSREECPDGPRYKALGNSWAVNCARWIGMRIQMVDQIRGVA